MLRAPRPPLWGNFVGHADEDMLAFGLLASGDLHAQAFYHGTQAVEKYLKALCLSIIDPVGVSATPQTEKWIKTHNLESLAIRCGVKHPYYVQTDVLGHLRRFAEFDQLARYPWVTQDYGNGFDSKDIPILERLCCQLRNHLPITRDDYKLGMEVRGHFHGKPDSPYPAWEHWSHQAVIALRKVFPHLNDFVRW
jgi:hypothetical protein